MNSENENTHINLESKTIANLPTFFKKYGIECLSYRSIDNFRIQFRNKKFSEYCKLKYDITADDIISLWVKSDQSRILIIKHLRHFSIPLEDLLFYDQMLVELKLFKGIKGYRFILNKHGRIKTYLIPNHHVQA